MDEFKTSTNYWDWLPLELQERIRVMTVPLLINGYDRGRPKRIVPTTDLPLIPWEMVVAYFDLMLFQPLWRLFDLGDEYDGGEFEELYRVVCMLFIKQPVNYAVELLELVREEARKAWESDRPRTTRLGHVVMLRDVFMYADRCTPMRSRQHDGRYLYEEIVGEPDPKPP